MLLNIVASPVSTTFVVTLLLRVAIARQNVSRDAAFADFNATVGGRLRSATPLALPCFSKYDDHTVSPDPQACAIVQDNYGSQLYRSLRYGNSIGGAWETCMNKNEQCLLDYSDPSNTAAYNETECSQGNISEYYLEVQDASDVIAAFAFSNSTGIPLSIKNSGHDVLGRSNMKGSLALWMRNLTSLSYHEAFIPTGCPAQWTSYQAITAGTGTMTADVYQFADQHNVTAVGGFSNTIAWHGGWVQGGGHSLLSPVYGLGVDRVLEFKVVTPDGQLRIANQCENSDLFWALRGGGGGTFGVVLEATSKVEKQLTLQVANWTVDPSVVSEYYELVVNNTMKWISEGWGGYTGAASGNTLVNPIATMAEANSSMKVLSDFVIATGGNFSIQTIPSWFSFFNATDGAQVGGIPQVCASRLIPKDNFASEQGRAELARFLTSASFVIVFAPPVLYNGTANETSVTPAWRNSYWHLLELGEWNFNSTVSDVQQVFTIMHNTTQALKEIAPQSGAYFNEAEVYEPDYEESFWGDNYPMLLKIKNKYDPDGLLDCWRCVGWKGRSKKFDCYYDLF